MTTKTKTRDLLGQTLKVEASLGVLKNLKSYGKWEEISRLKKILKKINVRLLAGN